MPAFASLPPPVLLIACLVAALLTIAVASAGAVYFQQLRFKIWQNIALLVVGVPLLTVVIQAYADYTDGGLGAVLFAAIVLLPLVLTVLTDLRGHQVFYPLLYLGGIIVMALDGTVFYYLRDFDREVLSAGWLGALLDGRLRGLTGALLLGGIFAVLRLVGWLLLRNTRLVEAAPEDNAIDTVMGSGDTAVGFLIGAALGPLWGLVALSLGIFAFGAQAMVVFVVERFRRRPLGSASIPIVPGLALGFVIVWSFPLLVASWLVGSV